jgi:caffeoyl-CoA O-methyltransferase
LGFVREDIEKYAESKVSKFDPLLADLEQSTYKTMNIPQMLCGSMEGRFLKMLVQLSNAKRVLEIGMFTGYSALSMAEGLPDDGELYTLELDPKAIEFAANYFDKSPHGKKIRVVRGPALDSIKTLDGPFDLVFIDADKNNYPNYYEAILPKLKSGGLIVADNVLWGGRVLSPSDESDHGICTFNDTVIKDERVEGVLLTIRDGMFLIRKR